MKITTYIKANNKRQNILDSVIGQMSDGIWENTRSMEKYWKSLDFGVDANGYITLTELGTSHANKIFERHRILSSVLTSIGVSEETASEDACRLEHVISDETFEAIKRIVTKGE